MKAHLAMMAAYNVWANGRLYAAAGEVEDADYRADLGAAFGSIHATLNHIMVADLIWIARIRGWPHPPLTLDHILHDDLAELTAARKVLDDDLRRLVDEQTDARLAGDFTYRRAGDHQLHTQPLAPVMAHVFNHQTHHRGQIHALMTRLGVTRPALDLIYYLREGA